MHRSLSALAGVALCCLLGGGCWLGSAPPRVKAPKIDPAAAGAAAIAQYDSDGDGALSGAELDRAPALRRARKQIDANGDGALTADEIAARIRSWQESKLGRIDVTVTITRRGSPLAGATVRFVPEEFLGDNMPTGTGVTDAEGVARINAPTSAEQKFAGMPPGLYRVEITKADERIPEAYNVKTVLGQEVALGAEGFNDIRFDLRY